MKSIINSSESKINKDFTLNELQKSGNTENKKIKPKKKLDCRSHVGGDPVIEDPQNDVQLFVEPNGNCFVKTKDKEDNLLVGKIRFCPRCGKKLNS